LLEKVIMNFFECVGSKQQKVVWSFTYICFVWWFLRIVMPHMIIAFS